MDFWHSNTCITGLSGGSFDHVARIFSSNCRRLLFNGTHLSLPFFVMRTWSSPFSKSTSFQTTCRALSIRTPEKARNRNRFAQSFAWHAPEVSIWVAIS